MTDIKYDDLYKLWEYFYKEIKFYKTNRNQIKSIISLEEEYKLAILSELFTLIQSITILLVRYECQLKNINNKLI